MNIFKSLFYITALNLIYLSLNISFESMNYNLLFGIYNIFPFILGLVLSLINFSFVEITNFFKHNIFKSSNTNDLKMNSIIFENIKNNVFCTYILYFILVNIIFLSNSDSKIFADYLSNILNIIFMYIFIKMFVFKPIEISILKKNLK